MTNFQSHEHERLLATNAQHMKWGPYLSERAWGTVREDYSDSGAAWDYFTHDHARSRAYRWNEDGLAGICDDQQYMCFALSLWNGNDAILKERLFGLNGHEGNHGEDVKELYYYLDSTPTHSYMRMLYKYPFAFPYADLVQKNSERGRDEDEYELLESGCFADDHYFDVEVEYAKAECEDILVRIRVHNRSTLTKACHVLPTIWFRNTWSWGYDNGPNGDVIQAPHLSQNDDAVVAQHPILGTYHLYAAGQRQLLFTENESNTERLFGLPSRSRFVKDAFHYRVINDDSSAVNPERKGTKAAAWYQHELAPGECWEITLRMVNRPNQDPFADFDTIFAQRQKEADDFYDIVQSAIIEPDLRNVQRQAFAGLLWSKQYYYLDLQQWLDGDPAHLPSRTRQLHARNADWRHMRNHDIILMPDKWEYPWYAAWDLAFHCLPVALVDSTLAKEQMLLMTRENYMHPNGQIPAYEWNFSDVNPPVHAWGTWHIYRLDRALKGKADRRFLETVFQKCLINFTWWVNRKDVQGNNIFQGGFLGLDNIGVFDRSTALPTGGHINQADGTAWMAFYSLMMLEISLELALENDVYEEMAIKFFEHFLHIAKAMTQVGGKHSLWDEADGFFYDMLHTPDGAVQPLRVRSLVGLVPLFASVVIEESTLERLPKFAARVEWLQENRPKLSNNMASLDTNGKNSRRLLSLLSHDRLLSILSYMLNEAEFLSDFGIRSLSKFHESTPFTIWVNGDAHTVDYQPAESRTALFGGNSNWRGPIWLPMNYLIVESLWQLYLFYGDELQVEMPTGSGKRCTLDKVARQLAGRLVELFTRDATGARPAHGNEPRYQADGSWDDLVLFYEYFHGDSGRGIGASHQTGWTGVIADLIHRVYGK